MVLHIFILMSLQHYIDLVIRDGGGGVDLVCYLMYVSKATHSKFMK